MGPILGWDQTMQMYGNVQGFLLSALFKLFGLVI